MSSSQALLIAYHHFTVTNYQRAIQHFNQHLLDHPEDTEVVISRAIAKINLGHYERALQDLEASGDEGYGACLQKGIAKFYLGEFENAAVDVERAKGLAEGEWEKENAEMWGMKVGIEMEGKEKIVDESYGEKKVEGTHDVVMEQEEEKVVAPEIVEA